MEVYFVVKLWSIFKVAVLVYRVCPKALAIASKAVG